jgi:hypothetical protein
MSSRPKNKIMAERGWPGREFPAPHQLAEGQDGDRPAPEPGRLERDGCGALAGARAGGGEAGATASTELVIRDSDGKLVYCFTLPCDPIPDPAYLAALVNGQKVSAIACERPGTAQMFYARTLDG